MGDRARRGDGIWVLLACAAALLAGSAPYLYGYLQRPAGSLFYAVPPVNYADATQYMALARAASEGGLLVGDPFTTEPHTPRLLIPHAVVEGGLARLLGGPLPAFHAARLLYGALLLAAAWWLGTLILPRRRQRVLYVALLLTSAGPSWLLEQLGLFIPNGDVFQPEGNTLFTLGNLPHLSLAAALLTALFGTRAALDRRDAAGTRLLAATVALSFLLAWTHPFDFLQLALGLGVYGLVRTVQDRRLPAPSLAHGAAVAAGAVPAAVYNGWLVVTDPFYRDLASDTLRVQPWPFYFIAHGLLLAPAVVVLLRPALRRCYPLPLCWAVPAFLFLLTPFVLGGKQPRVLGGVHVPLALLAAVGIDWIARAVALRAPALGAVQGDARTRGRLVLAVAGAFCLLAATGGWGILQRQVWAYASREPQPYVPRGVRRVLETLECLRRPGDVALGGRFTGGWIPVLAGVRVFHGHWHMTLDEPAKKEQRNRFFTAPLAAPAERAAWLRRQGIRWVILYPDEWPGGFVPLDPVPGLDPVFAEDGAALFRVR